MTLKKLNLIILVGCAFGIMRCNSGLDSSPDPGVLRLVLQSDASDTSIVIVADTYSVAVNDSFGVKIYQGKIYNDSCYVTLYTDLNSISEKEKTYNIIRWNGTSYKEYTIFESYVSPLKYDRIQFGMTPSALKIGDFDIIEVESRSEEDLIVTLPQEFYVNENDTTEIIVQIKPFHAITRYRDSYQFIPVVSVSDVIYK